MMKKSKKVLSLLVAVICIFSLTCMNVSANLENNNNSNVEALSAPQPLYAGYHSKADEIAANEKLAAYIKMNEIALALQNPTSKESSDSLKSELKQLLEKYGNGITADQFLANVSAKTIKTLTMTAEAQIETYYCGPAAGAMVLKGKGISTSQRILAGSNYMNTDNDGSTYLWRVPYALNKYKGTNGLSFNYSYIQANNGESDVNWAIRMTNAAIGCLNTNYGTIYDTYQIGSLKLVGYTTLPSKGLWHYVAGYGYNNNDPNNRICYYIDPNPNGNGSYNHPNSYGKHTIEFRKMGDLTKPLGLIF